MKESSNQSGVSFNDHWFNVTMLFYTSILANDEKS